MNSLENELAFHRERCREIERAMGRRNDGPHDAGCEAQCNEAGRPMAMRQGAREAMAELANELIGRGKNLQSLLAAIPQEIGPDAEQSLYHIVQASRMARPY